MNRDCAGTLSSCVEAAGGDGKRGHQQIGFWRSRKLVRLRPEREGRGLMKRLFVSFAPALPLILIASPSAAARTAGDLYVACLSQTQPSKVKELLQADAGNVAERPYKELSDDSGCFAKVFDDKPYRAEDATFSMDMLRGKLAEQALARADSQLHSLSPLPLQQKRYIRPWFAATGRNIAVDEMGACMADTDPSGIATLVSTDPTAMMRARQSAQCRQL